MYRFPIVIECENGHYGAYSPDLPGCVAVGDSLEEVEKNMEGAIRMHIQGMLEDNEPIPVPRNRVQYIEISLPDSAA